MKKLVLLLALLVAGFITAQEKLAVPYRQGNLYGLCDTLGKVLVKPVYDTIEYSRYFIANGKPCGRFMAIDKGVRKVINYEGKVLVDGSQYYHIMIDVYNPAITITMKGNKYGMVNNAKVILKPEYDDISTQYTGIAVVQKQGKYGVFNHNGGIIYPLEYDKIQVSDYGYELYYTLTKNGKETTKAVPIAGGTEEGLYDLVSMPDLEGDELQGAEVKNVIEGSNYCIVKRGWKTALYDTEAKKLVLPFDYFSLAYLGKKNGDFIFLAGNDKGSIINHKGKKIIDDEFDDAAIKGFHIAVLKKGKLWGAYMVGSSKPFIPCIYDSFELDTTIELGREKQFNLFRVKKGDTEYLIGENGVEYYKP